MRVLLTEDDLELADLTQLGLKKQGFAVDIAFSGQKALDLLKNEEGYDVIILDLNLPDIDGLKLLQKCKSLFPQIPVLALTARASQEEKIKGLKTGFDDYLTKPFSLAELGARIRVLCRWQKEKDDNLLNVGSLKISPKKQMVWFSKKPVKTSLTEFRLLCYLAKNKGKKVSSQELLESVWDRNTDNDKAKLMTTISRLRDKIGDTDKSIIKTINNGYLIS